MANLVDSPFLLVIGSNGILENLSTDLTHSLCDLVVGLPISMACKGVQRNVRRYEAFLRRLDRNLLAKVVCQTGSWTRLQDLGVIAGHRPNTTRSLNILSKLRRLTHLACRLQRYTLPLIRSKVDVAALCPVI